MEAGERERHEAPGRLWSDPQEPVTQTQEGVSGHRAAVSLLLRGTQSVGAFGSARL